MHFGALTNIGYAVARFMQGSRIKLEADDGEYYDGKEYQQADLQERRHRLDDRLEHHLKTYLQKKKEKRSLREVIGGSISSCQSGST